MKNVILLVLIALAFCLTELTLTYFFPAKNEDWDIWVKYFTAKDGTYDAMFFAFSLLLVWNVNEIRAKAISVFLLIMTGGSFLDKVIFGINRFVYADIGLIIGGLIVSIYLYLRWRKKVKNWLVKIMLPALVAVSMKLAVEFKRGTVTWFNVIASFITGIGSAYLCSGLVVSTVDPPFVPIAIAIITISGEKIGFWLVYKLNVEAITQGFFEYMLDKIKGGK